MVLIWVIFLWGYASFFRRLKQVIIAKNHKLFMSTTTVSVLFGVALAIAYIATNEQEDASYLIVITQFVLVACLVGWLFGMLLQILQSVARYLSQTASMLILQRAYLPEDGPDWEMIRIRREMIDLRLRVDEPVFCTKRGISCNCWSFCGGDPDVSAEQSALAPEYLVSLANKKDETDNASMATIQDRNVSDCSFL